MAEENPRCCTDCRHVLLTGSRYLDKMSGWGFVGCGLYNKEWTVMAPGFARRCKMFEAVPAPATQPEGALF
jgi:hypothetical protein